MMDHKSPILGSQALGQVPHPWKPGLRPSPASFLPRTSSRVWYVQEVLRVCQEAGEPGQAQAVLVGAEGVGPAARREPGQDALAEQERPAAGHPAVDRQDPWWKVRGPEDAVHHKGRLGLVEAWGMGPREGGQDSDVWRGKRRDLAEDRGRRSL